MTMDTQSRLAIAALCRASDASRDPELAALRAEVQELRRVVGNRDIEIQVLRSTLAYFQAEYGEWEFRDFDHDETVRRILAQWNILADHHV
jgi:hypothetical protein